MLKIRNLGIKEYQEIWQDMQEFTACRDANTPDEIWLLEHYPVYTQGQAGKAEHLLNPGNIPVINADRGGQITYHGPGQLVVYTLIDLKRRNLGIKKLVGNLEKVLIAILAQYKIKGETICGAPGVYVADKKIASIGLRVKNGCSYHGIALNVDMNLQPFKGINPCGFEKLEMTQIQEFNSNVTIDDASNLFVENFMRIGLSN